MKQNDEDIIDVLKRFETVNRETIQLSRRLSEIKQEILQVREKIKLRSVL